MIEEVKQYLRIDEVEDDIILLSLIGSSKLYIQNATGVSVDENNDLHKLAVMLLVAHSYENRLPIGKGEKLEFSLDSILTQIKYCSEGV